MNKNELCEVMRFTTNYEKGISSFISFANIITELTKIQLAKNKKISFLVAEEFPLFLMMKAVERISDVQIFLLTYTCKIGKDIARTCKGLYSSIEYLKALEQIPQKDLLKETIRQRKEFKK